MSLEITYCGYIVIVGRSNVGKSTLFNKLIKKKLSITSKKIKTTRNEIFGVFTENQYQIIYIDTPGIVINQYFKESNFGLKTSIFTNLYNQKISSSIFVVENSLWNEEEELILDKLKNLSIPIILAINKIDCLNNKRKLLPYIDFLSNKKNLKEIVPISAKKKEGLHTLIRYIKEKIPISKHFFSKNDNFIYHSKSFIASEIIREKLIRFLGDELPYIISVRINSFLISKKNNYHIDGSIVVNRETQKKIVIGKEGEKIKKINLLARRDMENFFGVHIHLLLWVYVES